MKLESLGHSSIAYNLGRQSELKFWTDSWQNNSTLAIQYPELFEICSNPNILLKEVI